MSLAAINKPALYKKRNLNQLSTCLNVECCYVQHKRGNPMRFYGKDVKSQISTEVFLITRWKKKMNDYMMWFCNLKTLTKSG